MVIIVPARPAALMSDGAFPMPYWSAKGTRLRYVTRAVVADDAQYDWTSPTLVVGNNRQTTAADIGAWQVVSDDGDVEFFMKGWPATPMTKLFPERQIYLPGAVPHPGVERAAAAYKPVQGKHWWIDALGPYDRFSRFRFIDGGDMPLLIERYDILSFYGQTARWDVNHDVFTDYGGTINTVPVFTAAAPPMLCPIPTMYQHSQLL